MSLQEYRRKRRFNVTPEPQGGAKSGGGRRFVVQKHDASHLHYDFRLEHDGVLLSWALPKGPSLDPREKRLAVHVEDHPLDYRDFEGTIPAGQYGGGTVMVWDRGTWEPLGDPADEYRAGRLKFTLHGEKLHGSWALVRMRGASKPGGKENWLLIKHDDDAARTKRADDVLRTSPLSVKTGRDMEGIAAGAAAAKRSKKPATVSGVKSAKTKKSTGRRKPSLAGTTLRNAPRGKFPAHPQSELAVLVDEPPEGDQWAHEIKYDGYRMFCLVRDGRARFISRNGKDWTDKFRSLGAAMLKLPVAQAVFDGEVVVLDEEGVSTFQLLQNALGPGGPNVAPTYYVFDLLHCDGHDVAALPLDARKAILQKLLGRRTTGAVRYGDHVLGSGRKMFDEACRRGLEGIVSKRRDAPYLGGRGGDWLKCKCKQEQEFVVVGFTDPGGSRTKFGALLLGYYDRRKLTYAGRVGTGFTERSLRDLHQKLAELQRSSSPLDANAEFVDARGVHWVRPKLVAQIAFSNWTDDGLLRHPAYQGLRDDKPASAVRRERPKAPPRNR